MVPFGWRAADVSEWLELIFLDYRSQKTVCKYIFESIESNRFVICPPWLAVNAAVSAIIVAGRLCSRLRPLAVAPACFAFHAVRSRTLARAVVFPSHRNNSIAYLARYAFQRRTTKGEP